MPEIGPTLREARMRARIDISEVEAETKIRAKYLRALENEEWDLLPGPTFVKSFLRTYADALGLDSRALVEEYKLRHERLSEVEMQPIAPLGPDRRPRNASPGIPRAYLVWGLILVILGGIYLATAVGGSSKHTPTTAASPPTLTAPTTTTASTTTTPATGHVVRLQVVPTGTVTVCLEAAGGRTLLRNVTLSAASHQRTFRSSEFQITLSNGQVALRVNGALRHVPPSVNPIGYAITSAGRRTLTAAQRPTCT
jgi:cytoskeletal protein RodZ